MGGSACETVDDFNRLGPVTLSVLWKEGQVFHLLRVQFKVPGDLFDSKLRLVSQCISHVWQHRYEICSLFLQKGDGRISGGL